MSEKKDFITVTVKDPDFFIDKKKTRKLSNSTFHMRQIIPKQLVLDSASVALKASKDQLQDSLDGATIATFAMNIAFAAGMNRFLEMVNALHIISYQ